VLIDLDITAYFKTGRVNIKMGGSMFGFGDNGSIKIELESLEFKPGQNINGKIYLNLPKPLQARSLEIIFYGEMMVWKGRPPQIFHEIPQQISGEKIYNNGDVYAFSIAVPSSLSLAPIDMPDNPLANFLKSKIRDPSTIPWFVQAKLDVPSGININAKVQLKLINV
jgi:hypothetical protein